MRRWLKIAGYCLLALLLIVVAAIPAIVGIRPIIGPRYTPSCRTNVRTDAGARGAWSVHRELGQRLHVLPLGGGLAGARVSRQAGHGRRGTELRG